MAHQTKHATDADALDLEIFERWVKVSVGLARFNAHATVVAQGLGRLDAKLRLKDRQLVQAYAEKSSVLEDPDYVQDHLLQSYLWVLGAYELLRTLTQWVREGKGGLTEQDLQNLTQARNRFERLRIPLAKMQAARRHQDTDGEIAYPGIDATTGIAWQLNPGLFISRGELSDVFLNTLEAVRASFLSRAAG
ncbi:hypothetical protein DDE05_58515 [Streptomyces cavourensis]|nr:hypothetical protein DDE05_58515 [Streptomyces cavourensis]